MRDGDSNLLILTLYVIGITYTFNQMVDSIDDQIKLEFNKAKVDEQLKEQELKDAIGVSFSLKPMYSIKDPKDLSINIENKSEDIIVYVDWDNCTFMEFDGVSRRVMRETPVDKPAIIRDLAVPQVTSAIVPKTTLKEKISSESVFELDMETRIYKARDEASIANVLKWKSSPIRAQKKEFRKFMDRKRNFEFSLNLVLRLASKYVGLAPGRDFPPVCVVNCPFTVRKLPWTYALPWNKRR
ncbi:MULTISPECIES: hypothetical protein [Nostocales]|uniref:Uncharacterized protein n=3 Tax=Nostocales TaxID=1161 RepID=A0A0C1RGS3_9CYAN|nr:hypothetical protein [Tolypothrix bouteillei]KAF3887359.1 hypothetical protein DA73_0400019095 [Tolypothrix bouteillei VB521301]